MKKIFFEDFVDWVNQRSYDELMQSKEYNETILRKDRLHDQIVEGLGGDEVLVEKYTDSYEEMHTYYCYFMCRKVAEMIIKIIAEIGAV